MTTRNLQIVYDGDCPFCQSYVGFVRLREAVDRLELVNARDGGALVRHLQREGYDLDNGMVAVLNDDIHYGPDAVRLIATLSAPGGFWNGLQRRVFQMPVLARWIYPWLVRGRRLWLRLTGVSALK